MEAELNGAKVISLGLFNQVITHTPTINLLVLLNYFPKKNGKKKNYYL